MKRKQSADINTTPGGLVKFTYFGRNSDFLWVRSDFFKQLFFIGHRLTMRLEEAACTLLFSRGTNFTGKLEHVIFSTDLYCTLSCFLSWVCLPRVGCEVTCYIVNGTLHQISNCNGFVHLGWFGGGTLLKMW